MADSMDVSNLTDGGAPQGDAVQEDTANSGPASAEAHPVMEKFEQLVEAHRAIADQAKSMEATLKTLRKDMKKLCKKRRKPSGTPSNLMKPIPLSDELCEFLGQPRGSKLTRGQVTSMVNEYAKTNNLKKPDNGRIILIDQPLATLLGLTSGAEVQIFKVPTHLKDRNHYINDKETPPAAEQ